MHFDLPHIKISPHAWPCRKTANISETLTRQVWVRSKLLRSFAWRVLHRASRPTPHLSRNDKPVLIRRSYSLTCTASSGCRQPPPCRGKRNGPVVSASLVSSLDHFAREFECDVRVCRIRNDIVQGTCALALQATHTLKLNVSSTQASECEVSWLQLPPCM